MRKRKKKQKTNWVAFLLGSASVFLFAVTFYLQKLNNQIEDQIQIMENYKIELQNDIKQIECYVEEPKEIVFEGMASWYGESPNECVGCRADLIMKNGERYDETKFTIAMNDGVAMNTWVKVINVNNEKETWARVTDTGGFKRLGRIADLSKRVNQELECEDLCEVRIIIPQ